MTGGRGFIISAQTYRYRFAGGVEGGAIAETLLLTVIATRSLHGSGEMALDVRHRFNPATRECVVEAGTPAGLDFNRILAGFLESEFGGEAFEVERIGGR
ncbi:hypothetical protein [Zavarzinella formosa]|uniref:hypothetical protein n=1 Tax=Zavarzinella formosa TaxID=360055 RepID=UPI0002E720EF|nr:hypothetical protein [Zavarzinella formosa]